ncbi:MAG: hypothetical protein K2I72_00360, partial [Bacilli bacterium]|nr:hypothetical protein [Bacilli bacterium]
MKILEEDYREAYLILKKSNPNLKSVHRLERVTLENGKIVKIGRRIITMKNIYQAMQKGEQFGNYNNLTEEQISWWTSHGLDLENKKKTIKEENYQQAYLLWKKQNSEKKFVPYHEEVTLETGESVLLGIRVFIIVSIYQAMKEGKHYRNYKDLTEEQIEWWTSHGLDLEAMQRDTYSEEECQEAYLIWRETHEAYEPINLDEKIILKNGKVVALGYKTRLLNLIYNAMLKGEHYGDCKDLTKEQIAWWSKQGVLFRKTEKSIFPRNLHNLK